MGRWLWAVVLSRRCETGFWHSLEVACQEMLAKRENAEVGRDGAAMRWLEPDSSHSRPISTQLCFGAHRPR